MKKTLQDQYLLIKEGKGHKGVFLTEAKRQFPNLIPINADVELTAKILKDKNVINENIVGLQAINQMIPTQKQPYEIAYANFLKEAKKKEETDKAEAKTVSKSVEKKQEHAHNNTDEKNIDNVIFDQVMMGYYAEMKDPKNADKTMEELKAIVLKNLQKDPIHYTKDGQFGIKGLGYSDEHPGLGKTKEVKGKYASSGMEPVKLNESVDEAYQMTSINVGNSKTGGKRFVPDKLPVSPIIIKRFGDHIVFDDAKNTLYVSAILYNNLIKGYADQPAIKKLIMDVPPMVKQLLNKTKNYGNPKMLSGYKFKQYFPFNGEVEIAADDKFNKDGTKQYYSKGDYLIPNLNKLQEDMSINESKLRTIIRSIIAEEVSKKPINENIHKRLKEIDGEVANEVTQSKLNKVEEEIAKRQAQLNMIDENEDLKDLTDGKKIKALQKEIKLLERAKAKLEKSIKGKKKEVLDETEDISSSEELDQDTINDITEKYNEIWKKKGVVSDDEIKHIANQFPHINQNTLTNYLNGYDPGIEYDI